uniref:Uncharacterized protein n=1 Tax=Aureoumbra lagunensis TaxID=44058 RepID=A0A6S8APD2_9STRA|mmetsp:Transcript_14841/g.19697  ORF Transcript_14841/g.19697 Transcript_14841/m.19697 type:complete len:270 (-) Transcript_14841:255-1064(-)
MFKMLKRFIFFINCYCLLAVPPAYRDKNDEVWEMCSVYEPEIVDAAEFALSRLKKLSDSGIYETLSLIRIIRAGRSERTYHSNTLLHMELASPYFASGKLTENFEFVVMKTKTGDQYHSFAIEIFPEMNKDAIEQFQNQAIERRKALRSAFFASLVPSSTEEEEEVTDHDYFLEYSNNSSILFAPAMRDLLDSIHNAAISIDRRQKAEDLLRKYDAHFKRDLLISLVDLSSAELHTIAHDNSVFSERRALAASLLEKRSRSSRSGANTY